ncbi:MAG: type 1 glutamine amidotransferase [Mangrovicoccus sp.]|nr:type 1 glutamine amidotransferase [Mangrovicoccus sp.]
MKIGLLQCGRTAPTILEKYGEYADLFAQLLAGPGRVFQTWHVVDCDFPQSPQAADAWVLTGSPHGVYEDHPFIPPLEEFLRQVVAARVPVAGICFGHQLLAQALGGEVVKHPGGWRLGPQDYEIEGIDRPVTLHAWHQDQVIRPPEGARVIATGVDCAVAAMAMGDHLLSLQPHPEFHDGIINELITTRRDLPSMKNAPIAETEARMGTAIDQDWAAQMIGAFLEKAASRAKAAE